MIHRLIRAVGAACLFTLLAVGLVLAHAHLEESDPADGETITTPYTLSAQFSEEFDPDRSFIRVVDSGGTRVAEGGMDPDEPTMMTVELPELEPGEYEARWQTVTPDDNGVERGTFSFTVATPPTPSPSAEPTTAPSATTGPTASVAPTASPTAPTSPSASPEPVDGAPSASGSDVVLALVLAAVAIGAVLLFIFARRRG